MFVFLVTAAVKIASLVAIFIFMLLLWRRTRIPGFAVLAAVLLVSQLYAHLLPYGRNILPAFEQFFFGSLLNEAVGLATVVVTALAWWNVYARTKRAEA